MSNEVTDSQVLDANDSALSKGEAVGEENPE